MKKFATVATIVFCALCAEAKNEFDVKIRTFLGGDLVDTIEFELAAGETQYKGFDGKFLAKRYLSKGFEFGGIPYVPNGGDSKDSTNSEKKTPLDEVQDRIMGFRAEMIELENTVRTAKSRMDRVSKCTKALETIEGYWNKNKAQFKESFLAYRKTFEKESLEESARDAEYKKLSAKAKNDNRDYDVYDVGSFCRLKIKKVTPNFVIADIDYAYAKHTSDITTKGGNNNNAVTKYPQFERFVRTGLKDVKIPIGRAFCFQFARRTGKEAESLGDALDNTTIFKRDGGDSTGQEVAVKSDSAFNSPLDTQGLFSEIKKNFTGETKNTLRAVFMIKRATKK